MRGLERRDGAKTRDPRERDFGRNFARYGTALAVIGLIAAGCATQDDGAMSSGGDEGGSNTGGSGGAGGGVSGGTSAGTGNSTAGTISTGGGGSGSGGTGTSGGAGMPTGGAGSGGTAGNSAGTGGKAGSGGGGAGGMAGMGGKAGAGGGGAGGGGAGGGGAGGGGAGGTGGGQGDACQNKTKDANETDVDCGGVCAAKCATNKGCAVVTDCIANDVCDASKCRARGCNATNCAYDLTRYILGTSTATSARGQVFVSWDATNLSLDFQIRDGTPQNDSANNWEDDSVEIYLDLNHAKATTYDADDFQINVPRDAGTLVGIGANINFGSITVVRTESAGGYELKVTLPWAALNGAGSQVGKTIGFDIGLNDDNGGGTRDTQVMLYGFDQNFNNTSQFGDLVLTP